ncbi:MAG: 5'-methylthioadenosine/adenosylhomocysteine nucleosidase [Thermoanaerobacteraceae bacterium]|nr:5'-methylthioadenosine/adenosylhomocysteine nucleosidase [Thermoanaerobacteraceae bacterium]
MLGILFPLAEERQPFENTVGYKKQLTVGPFVYREGSYSNVPMVWTIAGMGKVSAAMAAQALIDRYGPNKIIIAGVAGGLLPEMRPGDLVVATEVCQHDVDSPCKGYAWEAYRHRGRSLYKVDEELLSLTSRITWDKSKVFKGRLLTGDRAVVSSRYAAKLREKLNGCAVDMESAAIAQVAAANGIPFLVLRAVSDLADENALQTFKLNFNSVCGILSEYLCKVLEKL